MELDYLKIKINDENEYEFNYPKNESEMIFSVLKGKDYPLANVKIKSDSPIIIDIGSNVGASVVYFKKNYPFSSIYCFEPSNETYSILKKNVGCFENVKLHQLAVWNKEGEFKLNYGPEKRTGSFTLMKWDKDLGGEIVKTIKISSVIKNYKLKSIDLMKLDVEAVELDVLVDFFTTCPEVPIYNVFIEYHGIVILDEIKTMFSSIYNIFQCATTSQMQGVVLLVRK